MKKIALIGFLLLFVVGFSSPVVAFDKDVVKTSAGDLEISFIGHSSLMLTFDNKVIHVDPWSRKADYATMPKADLILITHHHRDHLDLEAISHIRTPDTQVVLTAISKETLKGGKVMANGDSIGIFGVTIDAVPAYNLVHKRDNGDFYHPKGDGNGYVLTFGDTRIHIGGDTENVPEIKALKDIDIAFLPMNLPYTMTPEMVADAAMAYKPKTLYPYHYGDTDIKQLVRLLKKNPEIKVRVKKM